MRKTAAAACGCGSRGESHVAVAGGMRARSRSVENREKRVEAREVRCNPE